MEYKEPIEIKTQIDNISNTSETISTNRLNLQRLILDKHLYPSIINDIERNIKNELFWYRLSIFFISLKYFFLVISPVISFSSSVFSEYISILNFISASLSSIGIGFDRLYSFSHNNSIEYNKRMNLLLKSIDIDYNKECVMIEDIKNKHETLKRNFSQ